MITSAVRTQLNDKKKKALSKLPLVVDGGFNIYRLTALFIYRCFSHWYSGSAFEDLQPVHCLCILNNSIDTELPHYVQTYNLAKVGDPNSQMEGIHFHFIELSKFMKNGTFDLKNPLQAWMKFFAEPEYFSTMPIKHYEIFEELKENLKASSSHYPLLMN